MGRTTPSHEAEKLAIAVALKDLERALGLFVRALSHESAPVSAEAAGSEREARRLVCEAYATISYAPDDQVNESPVCLGRDRRQRGRDRSCRSSECRQG